MTRRAKKKPDARRAAFEAMRPVPRSPAELAAIERVLVDHICAHPGHDIGKIGAALSIATSDLTLPVRRLVERGELRTHGTGRGTRYFPTVKAVAERLGAEKPARQLELGSSAPADVRTSASSSSSTSRPARQLEVHPRTGVPLAVAAAPPLPSLGGRKRSQRIGTPVRAKPWGPKAELPARMNLRVSSEERELWSKAAGALGFKSVSDWMRESLNTVAANAVDTKTNHASQGASENTKRRR